MDVNQQLISDYRGRKSDHAAENVLDKYIWLMVYMVL